MLKNSQSIRQFSQSFKLTLPSEVCEGKYTKRKLSSLCIIGYTTINDWVRKYMNIQISMAEENYCRENAIVAEVSGILKDEYFSTRHSQASSWQLKLVIIQSEFIALKDFTYLWVTKPW